MFMVRAVQEIGVWGLSVDVGGLKVVKSCSYEDTSYSLLLIILLDL